MGPWDVRRLEWKELLAYPVKVTRQLVSYLDVVLSGEEDPDVERLGSLLGLESLHIPKEIP